MRLAIALLTLASFGTTFAVAQAPAADPNASGTHTKKTKKKHSSKKKGTDSTAAPSTSK